MFRNPSTQKKPKPKATPVSTTKTSSTASTRERSGIKSTVKQRLIPEEKPLPSSTSDKENNTPPSSHAHSAAQQTSRIPVPTTQGTKDSTSTKSNTKTLKTPKLLLNTPATATAGRAKEELVGRKEKLQPLAVSATPRAQQLLIDQV